jgi:dihydroflavonol-4-reductase
MEAVTMNEDRQSTTVLVTGATGYIAKQCVLQLLQAGYQVRGTLRTPARQMIDWNS